VTVPAAAANPYGIQLFTVQSPSGAEQHLQTQEEADWYEDRRDRYLKDNAWPNVSDLMDLDRLLMLELMIYRWSLWLGQGFDYLFARVEENQLKTAIRDYSVEARQVKSSLGMDKVTRDKEKGESLADYTEKLLSRAKAFGYHRNEQYATAVTKIYQLRSMVLTYDRCDEEERRLLDLSYESILEWIRKDLIADWDEQQAKFRETQAMWIQEDL